MSTTWINQDFEEGQVPGTYDGGTTISGELIYDSAIDSYDGTEFPVWINQDIS